MEKNNKKGLKKFVERLGKIMSDVVMSTINE